MNADRDESIIGEEPADVADHIKAQYPDRAFFEYRELFLRHLIRDLCVRVPRSPGGRPACLDIGCNAGRYTDMLAQYGLDASGVDFSEAMLRDARSRYPELHFTRGDAHDLPYESGAFDAAISFGLVQCLPDWQQGVRELVRVLRPGGIGVIETNRAFGLMENTIKSLGYVIKRQMPLREVRELYRAHRDAGARPSEAGLRKIRPDELVALLREQGVQNVVAHDPRKRIFFHDFIWAVVIVKPESGDVPEGDSPVVTRCRHCRRYGIMRVRTRY